MVIPKQNKSDVILYFHDVPTRVHLGAEKTISCIRNSFYWPSMTKKLQNTVKDAVFVLHVNLVKTNQSIPKT